MLFGNLLFMAGVLCITVIRTCIKKPTDEAQDYNPKRLVSLNRFLSLGVYNFFAAWLIFKNDIFLFLFLLSVICKIILLKSNDEKNEWIEKSITICICIIISLILRVPKDNDSFLVYLDRKGTYHCLLRNECVKITTPIINGNSMHTKAEIIPIDDYIFITYYLYSKSSLYLKGENGRTEEIHGINIAGWWYITNHSK